MRHVARIVAGLKIQYENKYSKQITKYSKQTTKYSKQTTKASKTTQGNKKMSLDSHMNISVFLHLRLQTFSTYMNMEEKQISVNRQSLRMIQRREKSIHNNMGKLQLHVYTHYKSGN